MATRKISEERPEKIWGWGGKLCNYGFYALKAAILSYLGLMLILVLVGIRNFILIISKLKFV